MVFGISSDYIWDSTMESLPGLVAACPRFVLVVYLFYLVSTRHQSNKDIWKEWKMMSLSAIVYLAKLGKSMVSWQCSKIRTSAKVQRVLHDICLSSRLRNLKGFDRASNDKEVKKNLSSRLYVIVWYMCVCVRMLYAFWVCVSIWK